MKTPALPLRGCLAAAALSFVIGAAQITLSAAPVVLNLSQTGAINGQHGWTYNAGTGLRSSAVRGEPGGLFHVADDGAILPAGPRHFFTQAGLSGNPKMNNWLSHPVTLSGTTYVRFLVRLESRSPGAFGTDPNEFFFGFASGAAAGGFPPAFAALKIPHGGTNAGVETADDEGAAFYPDSRVALDDTLFVVARFNVNGNGNLTGIDVWLDPVFADAATPDHSTVFAEPGALVIGAPDGPEGENASFRLRAQNMPMRLDNLALGTSWADVVPPAYSGPTPRPPVVLAAPPDVVDLLEEIWTARAVLVNSVAAALTITPAERETKAIFLVDPAAPITGYQWLYNTTINIPASFGGTSQNMNFRLSPNFAAATPLRLPAGSTLGLRVTFAGGSATTQHALLTEAPSTEIITQPVGRTVLDGDRFSFSVTVDGPFDVAYQWFGPNGAIPGATQSILTLNPARVADSGEYYVVVSD
ncbi:MAG: immunoglobulin domain-containing protein [Opitutales bacterium]|nr:immunoglobulin domain-containing protein [Opitutales bacterium]